MRIAAQAAPRFARRCARLERGGATIEGALLSIAADRQAPVPERLAAADLLTLAGRPEPYRPLFEHLLDCDGSTAWDLACTFSFSGISLRSADEERVARILREDPDERRREAVVCFLRTCETSGATRLLIEVLEDRAQSGQVRGLAAEALTYCPGPGTAEACARCLSDPDPCVRFWAVFALGSIARFRRGLHAFAAARLEPLTGDEGEMPGYWSVGLEARAMLEDIYPERREAGEKERQAILADASAPEALRRWAECYSWTSPAPGPRYLQIQARYGKFTWRGGRKEKRARGRRGAETP